MNSDANVESDSENTHIPASAALNTASGCDSPSSVRRRMENENASRGK